MSKIDRTYFKWNPEVFTSEINLDDSKEALLKQGIIKEILDDDKPEYTGINETPWRVMFEDNKVTKIWYNNQSSFIIEGNEISGKNYKAIEPILNKNFDCLNSEIKNVEEMKFYKNSDILYVVCRDFFVTMIGIIKHKA